MADPEHFWYDICLRTANRSGTRCTEERRELASISGLAQQCWQRSPKWLLDLEADEEGERLGSWLNRSIGDGRPCRCFARAHVDERSRCPHQKVVGRLNAQVSPSARSEQNAGNKVISGEPGACNSQR